MSRGHVGTGAVLLAAMVWPMGACLRSACEAPGGCPHSEGLVDAGADDDAGVDAGPGEVDAGSDGGADAGSDGGADAGEAIECTQSSPCPAGTECDFKCPGQSIEDPYIRYSLGHGVCRPNLAGCHTQPTACFEFIPSYCDFEGRCVPGICNSPPSCPADCFPVDACGCLCLSCPDTGFTGR